MDATPFSYYGAFKELYDYDLKEVMDKFLENITHLQAIIEWRYNNNPTVLPLGEFSSYLTRIKDVIPDILPNLEHSYFTEMSNYRDNSLMKVRTILLDFYNRVALELENPFIYNITSEEHKELRIFIGNFIDDQYIRKEHFDKSERLMSLVQRQMLVE
jgi:hypothetical protein